MKLILCAACVFHAYFLFYSTLNHNVECEETSCIIYFLANFFLSQTVGFFSSG